MNVTDLEVGPDGAGLLHDGRPRHAGRRLSHRLRRPTKQEGDSPTPKALSWPSRRPPGAVRRSDQWIADQKNDC